MKPKTCKENMKYLLIPLLSISAAYSQVIDSYVDCHQGNISVTIADTSNSIYYLEAHSNNWDSIPGSGQIAFNDTSEILFSGIGYEMHTFDSIRVVKEGDVIISLFMPCIGVGIEQNANFSTIVSVEYYNLMGQVIKEPFGLYIEITNYSNHKQSVKKKYK